MNRSFSLVIAVVIITAPISATDFSGFSTENDAFLFGTDEDFTNGLRFYTGSDTHISWTHFLFRLISDSPMTTRRSTWTIGQNIYTPSDKVTATPVYTDRPYAGWTHIDHLAVAGFNDLLQSQWGIEIQLGIVGDAGADFVQSNWHKYVLGIPEAKGWKNHIPNSFGGQFNLSNRIRLFPLEVLKTRLIDTDAGQKLINERFEEVRRELAKQNLSGNHLELDIDPNQTNPDLFSHFRAEAYLDTDLELGTVFDRITSGPVLKVGWFPLVSMKDSAQIANYFETQYPIQREIYHDQEVTPPLVVDLPKEPEVQFEDIPGFTVSPTTIPGTKGYKEAKQEEAQEKAMDDKKFATAYLACKSWNDFWGFFGQFWELSTFATVRAKASLWNTTLHHPDPGFSIQQIPLAMDAYIGFDAAIPVLFETISPQNNSLRHAFIVRANYVPLVIHSLDYGTERKLFGTTFYHRFGVISAQVDLVY